METEKKDFLTWCVQKNLLSKEKPKKLKTDVSKGYRINFWDNLTPAQKHALSIGSQEVLRNVQKPEKLTPTQLQYQLKSKVEAIKIEPIYKDDPVNQTKLIQEYLQAVETVKKDKKLKTKEKLEKLLTPLVNLSKIVFPPNYSSHLPFIDEDIHLKNELNLDNLIENPSKYFIVEDTEMRELGVLRASNKNIHLSEQYLAYLSFCKQVKVIGEDEFYRENYPNEKRNDCRSVDDTIKNIEELIEPGTNCYSLNDIYKDWLLTLTPEKMKSNDLLDRILVTFTIKRALNGNKKAIDKLCILFQNTAEAIAVKMAEARKLSRYLPDIRQQARILLRLQITGFPPLEILKGLTDDNDKGFLRIPKNVKKFYIHWLTKEVPVQLKKYPFLDFLDVPVLLNPNSPIHSDTKWRLTPKAIRQFNSFSFRPNKNTNLYIWLFGTKRNPMQGRFCQAIDEELNWYYKMEGKTNKKENDSIDESNGNYDCDTSTEIPKKSSEKIIEMIQTELSKKKVCERDIEIVILKLKGFSYTELGKVNNISRRQVINIFNKHRQFLKELTREDSG